METLIPPVDKANWGASDDLRLLDDEVNARGKVVGKGRLPPGTGVPVGRTDSSGRAIKAGPGASSSGVPGGDTTPRGVRLNIVTLHRSSEVPPGSELGKRGHS